MEHIPGRYDRAQLYHLCCLWRLLPIRRQDIHNNILIQSYGLGPAPHMERYNHEHGSNLAFHIALEMDRQHYKEDV